MRLQEMSEADVINLLAANDWCMATAAASVGGTMVDLWQVMTPRVLEILERMTETAEMLVRHQMAEAAMKALKMWVEMAENKDVEAARVLVEWAEGRLPQEEE